MAIITTEDLAAYLRNELPTEDYPDLDGVRQTAEDLAEDICGRRWVVATGTPSTRYYAPRTACQDLVRIHDCVSITSVTNDGQAVPLWASSTGGYQREPLNAMDWTGEARPYEGIRYIGSRWRFDNYRATVAVTADWGWAAIPAQVERAVYVLARDIWNFRDSQNTVGFEEFLRAKAMQLLKRYRREEAKAGIGGPR